MKKLSIVTSMALLFGTLSAQNTNITFTAKTADGKYIALDSVTVVNNTKSWSEVLYYPDTVLIIQKQNGIEKAEMQNFCLSQNIPNPFDGTTNIDLQLIENEAIEMRLYDLNGKLCASLNQNMDGGNYRIKISVSVAQTYLLTVKTSKGTQTLKMLATKGEGDFSIQSVYKGTTTATKVHKLTTNKAFTAGDNFTYTGYAISNGQPVNQIITRAKDASNETITFTFPVGYEEVKIAFTAQLHDGSFLTFDSVKIKNNTQNKTITKVYPDTILSLTFGDANFPFAPNNNLTYTCYSTLSGQLKVQTKTLSKDTADETYTFTFVDGFKVGDIYYKPNGEPEGVVWWIADTTITIDTFYYGQHGKILSIDEQPSIMWGGPSYYIIYALDTVDGKYNTDLIMLWLDTVTTQLSPSNLETVVKPLFQAAPWCVAHGEGWYLPAIRELFLCFLNRPYLNAVLQTIPNATLINLTSFVPGEYHYWSSTLRQPFETSNKALTVFTNHLTVEAHQNSCVQLNGYANTRAMKRF